MPLLALPLAAVLELVRFTVAEGPAGLAANMALVQLLVPSIMELRPRFRAAVKVRLPSVAAAAGRALPMLPLLTQDS